MVGALFNQRVVSPLCTRINHSTGGMQFESPFGDAPAEEEGPPGSDEDHFGFIDDWRFHRAPRFASAPGQSG